MNTYIANRFADLIGMLHFVVMGALVFLFFNASADQPMLSNFGLSASDQRSTALFAFATYLLVAGLLATVISIHQQLLKMNEILKEK